MKCPHCKKEFQAPAGLYHNVERYGSKTLNVRCVGCGGVVHVRATRYIRIDIELIGAGNPEECEPWT